MGFPPFLMRGGTKQNLTPEQSGVRHESTYSTVPPCLRTRCPSLVSSVTGGPVPVYWARSLSAGGSKAVLVPVPARAVFSRRRPLSDVFPGQCPFPSLFLQFEMIPPQNRICQAVGFAFSSVENSPGRLLFVLAVRILGIIRSDRSHLRQEVCLWR